MPPSWGANRLLHPHRKHLSADRMPTQKFESVSVDVGIKLSGWLFRTDARRRGTVVYLHGLGDNRASVLGIAAHFTMMGFDVLAYDSRAHGESGGDACTYGYYEKQDLSRVLDRLGMGPVIAFGVSLGAAIALQAAADDPRVALVVALAPFSDLRTAAAERAPFFATRAQIAEGFRLAEEAAHFRADEVSAVKAAPRIRSAVILIHGTDDHETPFAHSERIYAALAGPKKLAPVPGAGHRHLLTAESWRKIDAFIGEHWRPVAVDRAGAKTKKATDALVGP
jgi:alpha-beta hydrolase superfamily lysophospholipase